MTKHGHGLPRKRPGRSAKDEIDAELPQLEPLEDDLPVLEAIDDLPELEALEAVEVEDEGPVKATCAASDDAEFDTVVAVEVPEMPKKEVADAVDAPLTRIAGSFGAKLRHQKVLVRFGGDGLIGSAIKQLVADKLGPQKPLLVVVRRGFGDEQVHEGSLPTVEVSRDVADGVTNVQVAAGDCSVEDLPMAMASHMSGLEAAARDAKFVFQFRGGAKPDATLRDAMAMALRDAGAKSAAVGARVLFDRELEERVQCSVSGNKATVAISLTDDDATTIDALSLVLPNHAGELDGKNVRFKFARESAAVQSFCVDAARSAGATLIEVGGQDDTDIVWPPLISVRAAKEVELRLSPNGRSRAAVLAAFERECAEHHDDTHGKHCVIDWPQDFALDAEALRSLDTVLPKLSPKRLCCTIAGDAREPVFPEPISFGSDLDLHVIRVDSEAGKPRELQRAIDRCFPQHAESLRGKSVRIEIVGDAAVSRSLKSGLVALVSEAGAMRLELSEGGSVDVLLPPMLAVVEKDGGLSISAMVDGRDDLQQKRAVIRELEDVEAALQSVTIASSPAAQAVADYVLEQGASRVVLDGAEPMQIHPPLFESAGKDGRNARFVIEPTGDDAMDLRMLAKELPDRIKGVGLLVGASATIAWPNGDASGAAIGKLVDALRDKKASKILLEAGSGDAVQLHPEPQKEAAPVAEAPSPPKPSPGKAPGKAAGKAAAKSAAKSAAKATGATPPALPAAAVPAGTLVALLGRRDEAIPPMVMIGIAAGDDEAHIAAVEAELQAHLPRFRGRAVLLIPQLDGADAPVRRPTALSQMLGRVVASTSAATLVFRGPDAQGRPHFQVVHSTVRAMPVGAAFGDPRSSKQPS